MRKILPVVMAGGTGSRLWPLSREHYPKQFHKLNNDLTMLQQTYKRLEGLNYDVSFVVTNEINRFLVAEQIRHIKSSKFDIILEPAARNTAPAIALAAFNALKFDKDAILLVLAADHVIEDERVFRDTIVKSLPFAVSGSLVTFGIVPNKPETGYGYIKRGDEIESSVYKIDQFVEKPNFDLAEEYLKSGSYYWNSGMFLFRADKYLSELKKFRPDIHDACEKALKTSPRDFDFIRADYDSFSCCPSESIDYAIMEKTDEALVVPMSAGWSDVGSWSMLWELSDKDQNGNYSFGESVAVNSNNNYFYSEKGIIAAVGISDSIIVNTADALLVLNKNNDQDVKKVVEWLKNKNRSEHVEHREVLHTWGKHLLIEGNDFYQIRSITINPGSTIPKQLHKKRVEHWVILAGSAKVTKNNETIHLSANESTFIPSDTFHSIENIGKNPLQLIEIRSGVYLGEDDVIRIDEVENAIQH